jgi:hypothetical protein
MFGPKTGGDLVFLQFRGGAANPVPDTTISRFRRKRGRLLRRQIDALAKHLRRDIVILDVGGRPDYWANVGFQRIRRIDLLNYDRKDLERNIPPNVPQDIFTRCVGDARDLSRYGDDTVDLVHSNSVIEHVGGWRDMRAMANEVMRAGRSGWVQTPAWEFPVEPHFRTPFMHWFGQPLRSRMLSMSTEARIRKLDLHRRRLHVERINLLSAREVRALFPERDIYVERMLIAKSYIVRWTPEDMALPA